MVQSYDMLKQRVLLSMFFILQFRTFTFFPNFRVVEEAYFALSFLLIITLWPAYKAREEWRFSYFELYVLLISFIVPFHAAIAANMAFGQPLHFGFLSERRLVLLLNWLLFFSAVRAGKISYSIIHQTLLLLSWGQVVINIALTSLLSPKNYISAGAGFVVGDGVAYHFRFQIAFILYGVIFYAIRGIKFRRTKDYFFSSLLYLGAIISGLTTGRVMTLALFIAIFYRMSKLRTVAQYIQSCAYLLALVSILSPIGYFLFPVEVNTIISKFSDAFFVASGSKTSVQDASASIRVLEVGLAVPHIYERPLMGNGQISAQWNGGTDEVIGKGFAEEDIGVLGIVFSFGLVGLIYLPIQYLLAWRVARQKIGRSLVVQVTLTIIMFTLISSITTGEFFWTGEISVFYIGLMHVYHDALRSQIFDRRKRLLISSKI